MVHSVASLSRVSVGAVAVRVRIMIFVESFVTTLHSGHETAKQELAL
ncbi:hypothetical protein ACGE24_08795 [Corynebacterium kroppenstedtii]